MKQTRLANGFDVIIEPRKTDTVAVQVSIGVGSNVEQRKLAGISHFIEHMMFEGTKNKTSRQITETIENIGGEMNAATSNERTLYYVKAPKKHFALILNILADMMKNPLFDSDLLEKERKVVLEEIKMTTDQPLYYQWILFQRTLFKKHPTKNPVYGSVKTVNAITTKDMHEFYKKWYVPNNMSITIVGNVRNSLKLVKKQFSILKPKHLPHPRIIKEPANKKPLLKKKKKQVQQAYMVLGYKTIPILHPDSPILEIISTIFYKGLSGRIIEEIRNKRGMAYSTGTINEARKEYGYFAFYLNTNKKNVDKCKEIILDEIKKLRNLNKKEIEEAKQCIESRHIMAQEDVQKRAEQLAFWSFVKDAKMAKEYIKRIKKVSKLDILRVAKKYLTKNYTMSVVEN